MSQYSKETYGVRFGYFNSNNNFIIHNECKFNSLNDNKLKKFKKDFILFNNYHNKVNDNQNYIIFHFYKHLETNNNEKFFLWVGVSSEKFEELMDSIILNDEETISRISSCNSCTTLEIDDSNISIS